MKILITLLTSLTLLPLSAASDLENEIALTCARHKKNAIAHENKGGTEADSRVFSVALKHSSHSRVPHAAIRRNSFEGLEDPHNEADLTQLEKWEKKGKVKKVMLRWTHQGYRRTTPVFIIPR